MSRLFSSLTLRTVTLRNRIMMSPMCLFAAGEDGCPTDWHLMHYGARAVGGVGLVMLEATAVEARGRISEYDLGLWEDRQIDPLKRLVRFLHAQGAAVGIQLAHAGRKAWSRHRGHGPTQCIGPSSHPYDAEWAPPKEMTLDDIAVVIQAFRQAAIRAADAGFDVVELHAAHGYLLHEFLSPLTNCRDDDYGGTPDRRLRFLLEVAESVRAVWPESLPLAVRLSATDWVEGGLTIQDTTQASRKLGTEGIDLIDCSSGGAVPGTGPEPYPGYQVPLAAAIRRETSIATAAVGLITQPEQAEAILAQNQADLIALGRELLRHPHWALNAAQALHYDVEWPQPYRRAKVPQQIADH